jgi:hypothetical protein
LSYHLHERAPSAFGRRLLDALRDIDRRAPAVGTRLITALATIRYVPTREDAAAWRAGFEQLLQTLAEVRVVRALCVAPWPDGVVFACEPLNPVTGRRPELSIETDDRILLIEVKCPALIDHQDRRAQAEFHLPARGVAGEGLRRDGQGARLVLPRDNVVKDFLVSAQEKFRGFSPDKPLHGVLVIVWDGHLYEPISSLRHPEAGLFTPNSFARDADGNRVDFEAVDGVVVMEGLNQLGPATQEREPDPGKDPFVVGPLDLPAAWCANRAGLGLDPRLAATLAAQPVEALAHIAEYRPQDVIFWIDPAAR